ncbi:MAG: molybdopterin biosynthesis protein [Actinobacteria bacterium]|nr:molybdopterin biosynthesis protein [Actinomycetota bacterium]
MRQRQFLDVVDEAEARRRFEEACAHLAPAVETVALDAALGRVLAADVAAAVDVPGFDRSNMDGFAVRATDTAGAEELAPVVLTLLGPPLAAGDRPAPGFEVGPGRAVPIATGAVVPRGADAVVMVEDTHLAGKRVEVSRPVAPGGNLTFAGSDIGRGDVVVRRGTRLTSRETGVLAAVGVGEIEVVRRPRVAVLSTGDEIVPPGGPIAAGEVYDSNQRILLDAVAELGCDGVPAGIVPDDEQRVEEAITALIGGDHPADAVLLSGGTSKGDGDVNAVVVQRLASRLPASEVLVHGVALKPGKPILLAVLAGRPVVVLPGFPTSAVFTFHEFVAPLLRRLSGFGNGLAGEIAAITPMRIDSVPGRTHYVLVDLVEGQQGPAAYPLGAGSGSVTAFGRADGFIRIPAAIEYLEEGAAVVVRPINPDVRPADLAAIGSNCEGFDHLLGLVASRGFRVKAVWVGSMGGVAALRRGEGDVAGIHLMDPATGEYNRAFVPEGASLLPGYRRRQGIVFRSKHAGLGEDAAAFLAGAVPGGLRMVNRNVGSGTRVLIDRLLGDARPDGYLHQVRTHHGVAAAVEQRRADWGMTLDTIATRAGLEFRFVQDERYDLLVRDDRRERPAVRALFEILADAEVRAHLRRMGFVMDDDQEGSGPITDER